MYRVLFGLTAFDSVVGQCVDNDAGFKTWCQLNKEICADNSVVYSAFKDYPEKMNCADSIAIADNANIPNELLGATSDGPHYQTCHSTIGWPIADLCPQQCSTACGCADDPNYVDEKGYKCADWEGYECAFYTEYPGVNERYGEDVVGDKTVKYTLAGLETVNKKCRATCGRCNSAVNPKWPFDLANTGKCKWPTTFACDPSGNNDGWYWGAGCELRDGCNPSGNNAPDGSPDGWYSGGGCQVYDNFVYDDDASICADVDFLTCIAQRDDPTYANTIMSCPKKCNLCISAPNILATSPHMGAESCSDHPTWKDAKGFGCDDWNGYECAYMKNDKVLYPDKSPFNDAIYVANDILNINRVCPKACGRCGTIKTEAEDAVVALCEAGRVCKDNGIPQGGWTCQGMQNGWLPSGVDLCNPDAANKKIASDFPTFSGFDVSAFKDACTPSVCEAEKIIPKNDADADSASALSGALAIGVIALVH